MTYILPYNQLMQAQEFKEISFDHQMLDDFLLEGLFNQEEKKENEIEEEFSTGKPSGQKKNLIRGKGRPKGEKNLKVHEKRDKERPSQENCKKGHWSMEENKRYHWFLEIYHRHFICKQMRRLDKIFKTMAIFIGSREAEQCRSHHQKMEKKHSSFANILLFLRRSHYASEDSQAIAEDLTINQIFEAGPLLSRLDLQEISTHKEVPPTPTLIKIDNDEQMLHQQDYLMNKQISFVGKHQYQDFFGDNYEQQLELDNLLL